MRLGLIALTTLTTALALSACSDDAPSEPPAAAPSASTPEPELITYAGGESPGIAVHGVDDERKLDGAPPDFRHFIGETAQELADRAECDRAYVGVTVAALRTDGFAVGGVNDCGGYAALWAVVDGEWQEIDGSQEAWGCSVLEEHHVPSDLVGTTCFDYDAGQEREYHQA